MRDLRHWAFDDLLMADLLGIDGVDEFVIYCAALGKKERLRAGSLESAGTL